MREDYSSSLIFASGAYFIVSILAFSLPSGLVAGLFTKSSVFNPSGIWFWTGFLGFCLGLLMSTKRLHLRFIETLEAALVAAAFWLMIVFVVSSAVLPAVLIVLLLVLFYFFEKNYKKFSWYKSGRAGFSGLLTACLFFVARAAASFLGSDELSLIGKADLVPSSVVAFLLLFSLYNLAEG